MADSGKDKKNLKYGKKKRGRRKRRRPAEAVLMFIFAGIFVFSAVQLLLIFGEYKQGSSEYEKLAEEYVQFEEKKTADAGEQAGEFPAVGIDFDALESVNGDFRAWLEVPVLSLGYPVVQGKDDSYYLTHTFEKKENSSGAIFMNKGAADDFSDWNTFLYGHNMKNGSMFGRLKQLIRDGSLCDSDPYFYLFTKEAAYRYRIAAFYVTEDGSDAYMLPESAEQAEKYLEKAMAASLYRCREVLPEDAPVVTLSTCYGKAGGTQRFVVHGVQDKVKEY